MYQNVPSKIAPDSPEVRNLLTPHAHTRKWHHGENLPNEALEPIGEKTALASGSARCSQTIGGNNYA